MATDQTTDHNRIFKHFFNSKPEEQNFLTNSVENGRISKALVLFQL